MKTKEEIQERVDFLVGLIEKRDKEINNPKITKESLEYLQQLNKKDYDELNVLAWVLGL